MTDTPTPPVPLQQNPKYQLALKAVAFAVPFIMGAAGYFLGNVQPVVRDICTLLLIGHVLPGGSTDAVGK